MKDYQNRTTKGNITTEIMIDTVGDYFGLVIDTEITSKIDDSTTERLQVKRYKGGVKIYTDKSSFFLQGEDLKQLKEFFKEI